jgi:hypothetical protein
VGADAVPALADGQRPPLRQLDKAPQHLRLAAMIVAGGCLLPWMPGTIEAPSQYAWLLTLTAKALMLGAAWLWLQQVLHDWGPKLSGVLGQLAALHFKKAKPDDDKKKTRRKPANAPTTLAHPFPTGLHALAAVLAIGAVFLATRDPRQGLIGSSGIPEVAMLGWAAFTWVHIANYERWGGFNPLFPLMFLGMLLGGALAVVGAATGDSTGLNKLMGLAGGAAVAAGGGLAAYPIAEAMMQAKKEGDRKKAEAIEARRAARQKKD